MANTDNTQNDVEDLIKVQIPNWNELFGQHSFCECNECESMTGAPAFLAHILYFLEGCKTNDDGKTPYEVLVSRAPYLPKIALTCENTNMPLQYIHIVLRILEFYTVNKSLDQIPYHGAFDVNDATLPHKEAYELLSRQAFPFSLPYNQPLDVIWTYLSKMKTSSLELVEAFDASNNLTGEALCKAALLLSQEDFDLLQDFAIDDGALEVFSLFGFDSNEEFQDNIFSVGTFMQRTGLTYHELIQVLDCESINPAAAQVRTLEAMFSPADTGRAQLYQDLQEITDGDPEDVLEQIATLLAASSAPWLDPADFKTFLDRHFAAIQETLLITPSAADLCNYDMATLATIKNLYEDADIDVSDERFKRLYRHIRLMRKTGLSVKETDNLEKLLQGVAADDFGLTLYAMVSFAKKYKVTVSEMVSLATALDVSSESVYAKAFLNSALSTINMDFRPNALGQMFSSRVLLKSDGHLNPVLLAGLGLSQDELQRIIGYAKIDDPGAVELNIERVSVFYSYVLVARMLRLSIDDLIALLSISGYHDALRKWEGPDLTSCDLGQTIAFIRFVDEVKTSGFALSDIGYVLGKVDDHPLSTQFSLESVIEMLSALKSGIDAIELQHPAITEAQEITEEMMLSKLLLVFEKEISLQIAGILNGTIVYGINLPGKPALEVPQNLSTITYNKDTGRLEVQGVLNEAQMAALPENLRVIVQPIYDAPGRMLSNYCGDIVPAGDRNFILGRHGEGLEAAARRKAFYLKFHPYLLNKLKTGMSAESVSRFVQIEPSIGSVIAAEAYQDVHRLIYEILPVLSTQLGQYPDVKLGELRKSFLELYRISLLISRFRFDPIEMLHIVRSREDFENFDFRSISVAQWRALNQLARLKVKVKSEKVSITEIPGLAQNGASLDELMRLTSLAFGANIERVRDVVGTLRLDVPNFRSAATLNKVHAILQLADRTGTSVSLLSKWSKTPSDFDGQYDMAAEVKNCFLLRYVESERSEKEKTITSFVLERQRDALINYILTLNEIRAQNIRDQEELCDYFLIDVPMGACMPTTPIRQAISTVQSFVHRCINKMESVVDEDEREVGVAPDAIDNDIWLPKSFFRTWQVTMEFLTNPYPYLGYKYITDKSDAAKALEETLLKSDITPRTVEDGYRNYLQHCLQTANLEIVSTYIDNVNLDNNDATIWIHVIGKSRSMPHKYYYRFKNEQDRWSFWEEIPVPVKENEAKTVSGAHVIFQKFRDRYYLFLPEFIKRERKATPLSGTINSLTSEVIDDLTAGTFWEVRIAVSEFYQGEWTAKKYLKAIVEPEVFENIIRDVPDYIFRARVVNESPARSEHLLLTMFALEGEQFLFRFFGPNSALKISRQARSDEETPHIQNIEFQNFTFRRLYYPVENVDWPPLIFLEVSDQKLINFAHDDSKLEAAFQQPFFFHDADRSYFVLNEPIDYTLQRTTARTKSRMPNVMLEVVNALKFPQEGEFLPIHYLEQNLGQVMNN